MLKALLTFLIFFVINLIHAQFEKSLVLDGCTNYLEIPDDDLLDYDEVLSIECWIKPNCDDENRIIVSKEWCQGEYGYYLSINQNKLFWSYSTDGFCNSPNVVQTSVNIPSNQFTHVAVVHNQSEVAFFVNGEPVESDQISGIFTSINNSSEPFRIGAYKALSQNFGHYFSGLIDEIRV